jgi:hypothetical protein
MFGLLLACLLPAVLLAGCSDPNNTATIRYRVIVTAEVDGEIVEGSSVMEMSYTRFERSSLTGMGGSARLKSEALVLDLKDRGTVYVLPVKLDKTGDFMEAYQVAVLKTIGANSSIGSLAPTDMERIRNVRGRMSFFTDWGWPLFVAFGDESNPRSIFEVDPKHLDRPFGSGVRLIGIDLEVTDAPLTNVLTKRLPWLNRPELENWEREKPGHITPVKDRPISRKIWNRDFFGNGSR